MKADTTESLGDAIDLDDTSDSPRSTIGAEDDIMMSDSTGFETDSTQTDDGVTDSSRKYLLKWLINHCYKICERFTVVTEYGSGDFNTASRFDGTAEGSGDETESMSTSFNR